MEKLYIKGGTPLLGEVPISGSKNAGLPILISTILSSENVCIRNVPDLFDVRTTISLLEELGATVSALLEHDNVVEINPTTINNVVAPYQLVKAMRSSILCLGPLLTKYHEAEVAFPGGCAIGARPVNFHLKGLQALGAEIEIKNGFIKAKTNGRLKGNKVFMDTISVTGTENIMMAATLAQGTTIIENSAKEPEIIALAEFLNKMGAQITGAGSDVITINGVKKLYGADYTVIPDRIETGTYLTAATATRGKIVCYNTDSVMVESILIKLQEAGAHIEFGDDWIALDMREKRPKAVSVITAPYPAFPTDMQAQFCALNAIAEGNAKVVENIFENRLMHVLELQRMGAQIEIEGNSCFITGIEQLQGTQVKATDLRASASLIIAGLVAQNETEIDHIYHLKRGYENIEKKFAMLGASVREQSDKVIVPNKNVHLNN